MDNLHKYRRLIVAALALVLIGTGVFQGVTGITINSEVLKIIEYIAMFGALYLLFILPKQYEKKEQAKHEEQSENQSTETDNGLSDEQSAVNTIDDAEKQNKTED